MAIAYLNGQWSAPEDAKVSVYDRGFMFGDGVYEVMPVYNGRVFTEDEHLARLRRSMGEIHLTSPHTDDEWRALFADAIARSGLDTALLYLQVTRGVAPKRDHAWPEVPPTVLVTVTPAPNFERQNLTPYRVVTREDFRWARGDIKVVSLIASGLLKNDAIAAGCDDAILIRDGYVTEATASNVFVVLDGRIVTPPKSNYLLHGITRDFAIRLAKREGIAIEERPVSREDLFAADEVWITSTGHEIWPIVEIDGRSVGNGQPGVMYQQMDALFQASKRALLQST